MGDLLNNPITYILVIVTPLDGVGVVLNGGLHLVDFESFDSLLFSYGFVLNFTDIYLFLRFILELMYIILWDYHWLFGYGFPVILIFMDLICLEIRFFCLINNRRRETSVRQLNNQLTFDSVKTRFEDCYLEWYLYFLFRTPQ